MNSLTEFQERLKQYDYDRVDSIYTKYLDRKTPWEPPLEVPTDGAKGWQLDVTQKCIALAMALEIPVGERVLTGLDKGMKADVGYVLLSNAADEDTHYQAFSVAHRDYKVANTPYDTEMARLVSLMPNTGHEVFQAGYLELSIFMVTLSMLRLYGSSAINTLVFDVSRDESVHVLTNVGLTQELNLGTETTQLRNWRSLVIDWLTSEIPTSEKRNGEFWLKQSNHLYDTRQAPDLDFTKAGLYQAFFESSASSRGGYTKRRRS